MFTVQIRTVTYTLALVSSAQVYQEELRYAAQLNHYFCKQEEDYQHQSERYTGQQALVSIH